MLRRRSREPAKRWSALALFGMLASQACDVIFQSRRPMSDATVLRLRSQKKKRLLARRRNEVQG